MGWFQVFGGTTAECVCEGLMAIFLHIGGVPHRIVFDNATGIGRRVAGEVRESSLFRRFRLHFGFEATFCNPHAGHDRKTVRKYLQVDDFSPEAPAPRAKGPSKLDPFKDYIDRTLEADRHEWRKQRHTATRIYGEILEMGYEGKYSLVQCYVRERKREMRQAPSAFHSLTR